ncbi:hypothetical protein ES705_10449 [subsurface metagenome]
MKKLVLSNLPKAWIMDIDGVICEHNKYKELKLNEFEPLLPGVKGFFERISSSDFVILITSRKEKYRKQTERSLKESGIRYDVLIMDLPVGERILINDQKLSGLKTAFSVNLRRNEGLKHVDIVIDMEK